MAKIVRIPDPVYCPCPEPRVGLLETPPRWHATVYTEIFLMNAPGKGGWSLRVKICPRSIFHNIFCPAFLTWPHSIGKKEYGIKHMNYNGSHPARHTLKAFPRKEITRICFTNPSVINDFMTNCGKLEQVVNWLIIQIMQLLWGLLSLLVSWACPLWFDFLYGIYLMYEMRSYKKSENRPPPLRNGLLYGMDLTYTPSKKKLLTCSTWILKNRGVTFFGQCSQL